MNSTLCPRRAPWRVGLVLLAMLSVLAGASARERFRAPRWQPLPPVLTPTTWAVHANGDADLAEGVAAGIPLPLGSPVELSEADRAQPLAEPPSFAASSPAAAVRDLGSVGFNFDSPYLPGVATETVLATDSDDRLWPELPQIPVVAPASGAVSLGSLLELAWGQNLELAMQRIRIDSGLFDEKKSDNAFVPNLDARMSSSLSHYYDKASREFQGGSPSRTTLFTIALTQSYPALGKPLELERNLSRLRTLQRRVQLHAAMVALARRVIDTWLGLVRNLETIKIHRQNLELIGKLRDIALLNQEVGIALKNDILRIEVQQANIQADLTGSENEVDNHRLDLCAILNCPPTDLPPLAFPRSLRFTASAGIELLASAGERLLVERDSGLRLARTDLEMMQKTVAAARQAAKPTLSLGAQVDYAPNYGQLRDTRDFSVNVGLSGPLYDSGDIKLEVKKTEKACEAAKLYLQHVTNLKRTAWHKALADYHEVCARLRSTSKALEQSRENMRMVMVRYQHGDVSVIELVDAQITLTNAQKRAIEADHDERQRYAEILLQLNELDQLKSLDHGALP